MGSINNQFHQNGGAINKIRRFLWILLILALLASGTILILQRAEYTAADTPAPPPAVYITPAPASAAASPAATAVPDATEVPSPSPPSIPIRENNRYNIQVKLDTKAHMLDCGQTLEYTNATGRQLQSLYFHLYPNVFKDENNLPLNSSEIPKSYPNGFSTSGIEITGVAVNSRQIAYNVTGQRQDLLEIMLPESILPGGKASISIAYKVRIPDSRNRFGYGKLAHTITNFFPKLVVYDQNGWSIQNYCLYGDSFYSDVSDYSVTITAPADQVIACSGIITSEQVSAGIKTLQVNAPNVRDFAFMASSKLQLTELQAGTVTVKAYTEDKELGLKLAQMGANAINLYGIRFGVYPYAQYSLVQSDMSMGGMEYPNIVFIKRELFEKDNIYRLEYVAAHESAHQWWYGVVGNNEVKAPWLDESLTEFSTLLYYEGVYGIEKREEKVKELTADWKDSYQHVNKQNPRIDRPLFGFSSMPEYSGQVYSLGALMYDALNKELGNEVFHRALQRYYEKYRFQNATAADLIAEFSKAAGKDVTPLFEKWLNGVSPIG